MKNSPPRVFGIVATEAPVVAVIRRGPSKWSHFGRWDLATDTYEPGAWVHARVYPQRCDLSPDGRWFAYMALHHGQGATFIAVSKLPWATALQKWDTCGTWDRGIQFVALGTGDDIIPPHIAGSARTPRYSVASNAPIAYSTERRHGWVEHPDSPARAGDDHWDENRAERVVMAKPRPDHHGVTLRVHGYFGAFREGPPGGYSYQAIEHWHPQYELEIGDDRVALDVQWADWDARGRLLVATKDGRLQVRAGDSAALAVTWEHDLRNLEPDPQPPPPAAASWG